MKKFTLSRVLDGFRSSVNQGPGGQGPGQGSPSKNLEGPLTEIPEPLRAENFQIAQTVCHGFPYQPTAMTFDPVQRLLAIGTKNGCLRILGRAGVDINCKHDGDCCAILHLQFVVNEGLIISATSDDTIHLWNFRETKKPEVVQSLKFQRERITSLSLPLQSKWIYVGTERGNVHVVNIDTFQLSGYIVNWNKAIEVCRKTHPGSVIFLGDNPTDSTKLLIGFDSGQLVLWDLKLKVAEIRYQSQEPLRSVSWHSDGKQFMTSHSDGSIATWNLKVPNKPVAVTFPHSRNMKDGRPEPCKSIQKVEWKSSRTGENFVIFSGGLTADRAGKTPSLTVIHGKTTTVLEMEHNVLDFVSICENQWESEIQDPYAVVVLLQQDLVVIDLLTPGYPCIPNPYPMDIHESPVTCCTYMADCPGDLIPALYSMGSKGQKKTGFSERDWPIEGGQWGTSSCSYAEIIITGHADGGVKFWDASSTSLQFLYKIKTSKPFERPKSRKSTESCASDDDPFAVQYMALCPESRLLAVAGASCQVLVYKYRKQEVVTETAVLEIPIIWDIDDGSDYLANAGNFDFSKVGDAKPNLEYFVPIRIKLGPQKKAPGYQAEIVCLTPWVNGEPPGGISSLALNSNYGILAYGNDAGLVIVDTVQKTCLMSVATPDLYGTSDPYQRAPKSPKRPDISEERSPTDQVSDLASTKSMEMETPSTQKTPSTTVPDSTSTSDVELFPTNHRQSLSGSMSKLPSAAESATLDVELQPNLKCRSTTPPATMKSARSRSHTWSQVKGLIIKNVRESKKSAKSTNKQTTSPDTTTPINQPVNNDTDAQQESSSLVSPSLSGSSSSSSSPSLSGRPTTLDLEQSSPPVPPPRSHHHHHKKKKKSSLFNAINSTSGGGAAKKKCVDLRSSSAGAGGGSGGAGGAGGGSRWMKKFQKLDTTFSRSRSSSMSSLDNITSEAIQCLSFVDSFAKKGDFSIWPTLWVGTSLGSIIVISIIIPVGGKEARKSEPVSVAPSGTIFRIKGPILMMSFLDCNGLVVSGGYESWRDESKDPRSRTPTKGLSSDSDKGSCDRQFGVFMSEKQARVVSLPSQTCLYKQQICEASFVIKAEITTVKDSSCLVCYASDGRLKIYSLPSLRPLLDTEFVPLSDLSFQTRKSGIVDPMLAIWGQQVIVNEDTNSIAKTFCLSSYGHGMYLSSPSEIQKFTIATEFISNLDELLGLLWKEIEMPEKPKESFFGSLFGVGVRNVDREELFGEAAGKTSRSVAKLIPGPGTGLTPNQEHLQMRAGTIAGDISKTRMLMVERGQKLGDLGDKTEKMMNESENFSSAAHQLMLKYKDKKWYQL
ncbi:syntaxin-binding protein 5 isoform X2 [Folsomia candida]|uniref:syntaxin-binding protein 5 isoform X2 n=1 Tax=Folsomia candida TaxID=158441 RepID=UPI000B8FBC53|nr:syntaxin-binding protein 5 isoform X2 [Folsomia candida]